MIGKIWARLLLSRAKHPSLRGHAKMAQRVARHLPFYEYGEEAFFSSDGAPVRRRRETPRRVRAARRRARGALEGEPETERRAGGWPARFGVRERAPGALSVPKLRGLTTESWLPRRGGARPERPRSRRQLGLRPRRRLRRQPVRSRVLQGDHGARNAARPRPGDDAGQLSSAHPGQRPPAQGHLGHGRRLVSHVRHRGRHAGRAPRSLSHAALAPGPVLRRVSRLVGRRAGGRRQSAASARDLHAQGDGRDTLRVLRTRDDIACVLVNPIQAMHPNGAPPGRLDARRERPQGSTTTGLPTGDGCGELREVCTARGIVLLIDDVFLGFPWPSGAPRSTSACGRTSSRTARHSAAACPSAWCAGGATSCGAFATTVRPTSALRAGRSTRTGRDGHDERVPQRTSTTRPSGPATAIWTRDGTSARGAQRHARGPRAYRCAWRT